ncbi:MFS transporter [Acidisphaera sp. L21]|uniref:MFS transporter n=1 Tax=Acidisphaera sp. L21 TaxID=1641851 RepID=UPI00131B10AE|nr:MFS transporter [Acidisphaera sp. L21]
MQSTYWRRNLYVCLFGSFTTLVSMTLLLPFLPLYVEQLGVSDPAAIVQWSGIAFAATFLTAASVQPLWGWLADRYGRKSMLIRASLGMAVTMSMMGLVQNVWQLVLLRLLVGLAGGYSSGSIVLVATQTPREKSGWALGTLSIGVLSGSLVGPLIGGVLPDLIGVRETFFFGGGMIAVAFVATCLLVREDRVVRKPGTPKAKGNAWRQIPDLRPVLAMLLTAFLLLLANMSIEPIITIYVSTLDPGNTHVARTAGFIMAAAALASIIAAPRVGRLADRFGPWTVVMVGLAVAAALLLPQALVTNAWQLMGLRFLMGLALAGLLPSITSIIRHSVPDHVAGQILGYSQSAQFAGQVIGPLMGGFVGGHVGIRSVFYVTSALMLCGAGITWLAHSGIRMRASRDRSEADLR